MKRPLLRGILVVVLLVSACFAAWSWCRPYAWNADPAARCKIVGTHVTKDHSFFWVEVHLKMNPGQTHDLLKPVRLRTAAGKELEPANTTLGGGPDTGTTEMWFKFWLESAEIEGPLVLRVNDGTLVVKETTGMPASRRSNQEYFVTHHW